MLSDHGSLSSGSVAILEHSKRSDLKAEPSEHCADGCGLPAGLPRITAPGSRMHHMAIALSISLGQIWHERRREENPLRRLDALSTLCAQVFHVDQDTM